MEHCHSIYAETAGKGEPGYGYMWLRSFIETLKSEGGDPVYKIESARLLREVEQIYTEIAEKEKMARNVGDGYQEHAQDRDQCKSFKIQKAHLTSWLGACSELFLGLGHKKAYTRSEWNEQCRLKHASYGRAGDTWIQSLLRCYREAPIIIQKGKALQRYKIKLNCLVLKAEEVYLSIAAVGCVDGTTQGEGLPLNILASDLTRSGVDMRTEGASLGHNRESGKHVEVLLKDWVVWCRNFGRGQGGEERLDRVIHALRERKELYNAKQKLAVRDVKNIDMSASMQKHLDRMRAKVVREIVRLKEEDADQRMIDALQAEAGIDDVQDEEIKAATVSLLLEREEESKQALEERVEEGKKRQELKRQELMRQEEATRQKIEAEQKEKEQKAKKIATEQAERRMKDMATQKHRQHGLRITLRWMRKFKKDLRIRQLKAELEIRLEDAKEFYEALAILSGGTVVTHDRLCQVIHGLDIHLFENLEVGGNGEVSLDAWLGWVHRGLDISLETGKDNWIADITDKLSDALQALTIQSEESEKHSTMEMSILMSDAAELYTSVAKLNGSQGHFTISKLERAHGGNVAIFNQIQADFINDEEGLVTRESWDAFIATFSTGNRNSELHTLLDRVWHGCVASELVTTRLERDSIRLELEAQLVHEP